MTLTTSYTLVPFLRSVRGRLHPGVPRRAVAREAALAEAEGLAPFYAGVVVLKHRSEAGPGLTLEPLVVCVIGEVPDDLLTRFAA